MSVYINEPLITERKQPWDPAVSAHSGSGEGLERDGEETQNMSSDILDECNSWRDLYVAYRSGNSL
jgi:hypothetical protein